jgi:hypothetical protein
MVFITNRVGDFPNSHAFIAFGPSILEVMAKRFCLSEEPTNFQEGTYVRLSLSIEYKLLTV